MQRERLDPLTLAILADAITGEEVASMALQDRLEELDRLLALEAWRWALEREKKPIVIENRFVWYGYSTIFRAGVEKCLLPVSTATKAFNERFYHGWPNFKSELEAFHWLLVEWERWDKWEVSVQT